MLASEVVMSAEQALACAAPRDELRIGLVIPQSGIMGLTGPAALAAAVLAAEEACGSSRLDVRLVPIDAGATIETVRSRVEVLIRSGSVHALCGFHTSDVHRAIERVAAGRVPYLFTPPHEGGSRMPGVALMGPGPRTQLLPVVRHLGAQRSLGRWALIGNDYIWPQRVHAEAAALLHGAGADVVADVLVPFSTVDAEQLIDKVRRSRAQAILISLVGRDLATFNRAFAESGLGSRVVRVSGALEETGLLEIDGDDTGELYASMPWYATDLDSGWLAEGYRARWGRDAPALGAYSAGCYEGVHLLVELLADPRPLQHFAARVSDRVRSHRPRVARADGLDLQPV